MVQGGRRPVPCNRVSALWRGRIARIRRRLHERIHLRLAIVEGHHGRLVPGRYDNVGYARHGLEARLDGAGARGAGHMLNRERDRLLGSVCGRRSGDAKPKGDLGKQFDHADSSQEFSRSGANKSKAIAPATRIVARTRPALTIWFGSGRAQAAPSRQATFLRR